MKILTVVHNFPPEFTGGVERTACVLAQELTGRGHEVLVFTGSRERSAAARLDRELHRGIEMRRFRRAAGYDNVVDTHDPECEAAFERVLDEFRPDVVHVHHWYHLSTGLIALAARRRVPAVATLHDFWTTCALFFRLPDDRSFCRERERKEACLPCVSARHGMEAGEMNFGFDMRFSSLVQELSLARALMVSSESHARDLALLGRMPLPAAQRLRIVPIGAAPLQRVPAPTRRKGEEDRLNLVHWGNLHPLKGAEVLVQAASRARSARRIRLRLLGASGDETFPVRLRDLAGGLRLDIPGAYEPDRLPELVADADLAVFPSLAEETHSIVLDEALTLGLPVIVSDRGALPERIGGQGLVVKAGDVDELAAAIDRLADPEARRGLLAGEPARVTTTAAYAAAVEAVYRDAVEEGAPAVEIRDFGRDRLAFRNRRLGEIARFVAGLEEEKRRLAREKGERSRP